MDNIEQWDTSTPRMRELMLRFAAAQKRGDRHAMQTISDQMRREQERITAQDEGPST